MPKEKLNPDHSKLTAYQRVEKNARNRAKEIQKMYLESVPQAKWLRLDVNGAVLMTPEEFSMLQSNVREFFSLGNMSHYKDDRVALRGENVILLDGHYSGGVSGNLRSERFLSVAEQCSRSIPALLAQLSDQNKEQWKAKIALSRNH